MVNIEIKPEAFEADGPADAVERQVLNLVREKNMLDDGSGVQFRMAGAGKPPENGAGNRFGPAFRRSRG
jgi:hypothetical protein